MAATSEALEFKTVETRNGALWQQADLGAGRLILTSAGIELRSNRPEIEEVFVPEYIDALLNCGGNVYDAPQIEDDLEEDELHRRVYVARGGFSEVFTMAPDVVVKEVVKSNGSPEEVLNRMDCLSGVINSLPDWIDVPAHYGVFIPSHGRDDYMAIQKINSGVVADWVLDTNYFDETTRQAAIVDQQFGQVCTEEKRAIRNACAEAYDTVATALEDAGLNADEYLTDFDLETPQNLLLGRLEAPIDGKYHKLWIIDQ